MKYENKEKAFAAAQAFATTLDCKVEIATSYDDNYVGVVHCGRVIKKFKFEPKIQFKPGDLCDFSDDGFETFVTGRFQGYNRCDDCPFAIEYSKGNRIWYKHCRPHVNEAENLLKRIADKAQISNEHIPTYFYGACMEAVEYFNNKERT